jgi:uncharacterized protein (TIGR02145 family)
MTAIKFNPTNSTPANYAEIPGYTSTDWDNGEQIVSSPNYHNVTNLSVGKGDPCKLVGLNTQEINDMLAESKTPDSGYRLPTPRENHYFVGDALDAEIATASLSNSTHPYWTTNGVKGGRFPITAWGTGTDGSEVNTGGAFIPAAGERTNTGKVSYQNVRSYYWSSTPKTNTESYFMYFIESSIQMSRNNLSYAFGFAIRCVKPYN